MSESKLGYNITLAWYQQRSSVITTDIEWPQRRRFVIYYTDYISFNIIHIKGHLILKYVSFF